uniref:Uncharacterized protein n=1 Tax=Lactuca sativa TaxID=4236 RepID=A0A9R1UI69_LACSA|nr:hypothetical protein LSAT_V11C900492680 [Lactuca sativa]
MVLGVIVQQKKPWGTVKRQFVPSCVEKSFDISCIPNSLLVNVIMEMNIQKSFYFFRKATTLDCKSLPFPISKYTADEVDYDYFHLELFTSNT